MPKRKSAHKKRKQKHTQKKFYSHALLVLERQRRAVSFSLTIHSKQINKASNIIFRTTKSARLKKCVNKHICRPVTTIHKTELKFANKGIKSIDISLYLILTDTAITRNIMNTTVGIIVRHSKTFVGFIGITTPQLTAYNGQQCARNNIFLIWIKHLWNLLLSELSEAYKYLTWRAISQLLDNISVRNTPEYFTESAHLRIFSARDSLGLKSLQYFTPNIKPYDLLTLKTILYATVYFELTGSSSLSPDREAQKQPQSSAYKINCD